MQICFDDPRQWATILSADSSVRQLFGSAFVRFWQPIAEKTLVSVFLWLNSAYSSSPIVHADAAEELAFRLFSRLELEMSARTTELFFKDSATLQCYIVQTHASLTFELYMKRSFHTETNEEPPFCSTCLIRLLQRKSDTTPPPLSWPGSVSHDKKACSAHFTALMDRFSDNPPSTYQVTNTQSEDAFAVGFDKLIGAAVVLPVPPAIFGGHGFLKVIGIPLLCVFSVGVIGVFASAADDKTQAVAWSDGPELQEGIEGPYLPPPPPPDPTTTPPPTPPPTAPSPPSPPIANTSPPGPAPSPSTPAGNGSGGEPGPVGPGAGADGPPRDGPGFSGPSPGGGPGTEGPPRDGPGFSGPAGGGGTGTGSGPPREGPGFSGPSGTGQGGPGGGSETGAGGGGAPLRNMSVSVNDPRMAILRSRASSKTSCSVTLSTGTYQIFIQSSSISGPFPEDSSARAERISTVLSVALGSESCAGQ